MFGTDAIYIVAIIFGVIGFGLKILERRKSSDTKQNNYSVRDSVSSMAANAVTTNSQSMLSKKCASCGATISIQDGYCKYCGSSQKIVTESNYSYSEHIERKIDEAQIKEIEYKKEALKHTETWWQRLLTMILVPVGMFFLIFLFVGLMIKFF